MTNYSAKHWAIKAEKSSEIAKTSEQNAKNSENNAKVHETNAANSVETQTNNFNSYNNQLLSATSTGVSEINNTKTSSIVELDNKLSEALNEINSKTNVLDKTMITNCITHIPQDIKLELNNGTLTLKAGSKVYVPNGVGVFDEVTITDDVSFSSSVSGVQFICYSPSNNALMFWGSSVCSSGSTMPSTQYFYWYDTTNNLVKVTSDYGSTIRNVSLPLAICSASGGITSIDQVFNGFGFIGSTVFALPGVRGLIPDGRNVDGSLKNIEFELDSVKTETATTYNNFPDIFVGQPALFNNNFLGSFKSAPQIVNYSYYYNESENMIYSTGNEGKWSIENRYICVGSVIGSTTITSFKPKTTFQAVDRNDSSWLSGLGMPSNKYIDLTLGASGATYTMPATGWLKIDKSADDQQFLFVGVSNGPSFTLSSSGSQGLCATIPVKKNDKVSISYNASRQTNNFIFIYAEGSL